MLPNKNLDLNNVNIQRIATQLQLDLDLFIHEIQWVLGEERINRVTPSQTQFKEWTRQKNGLDQFWSYANSQLDLELTADEVKDIWNCIKLTLNTHQRQAFTFQDYLMIAVKSDQKCEICNKQPPEVKLEIDHILPISKGGSNTPLNLRFLCQYHNRSRGNRFKWADVWRRS